MPLVSVGELALRQTAPKQALVEIGRALAAFGAVFLPFLAFRWSTFGLPLPHTYYAKLEFASQGERLGALFSDGARGLREKVFALGDAFAGPVGLWLLLAGLVGLTVVARRRMLSRAAATAVVFLGLASVAYVWMPNDWMGEYRFATPAVAMAWVTTAALAPELLEILPSWAKRRPVVLGVSGVLAAVVAFSAATRLVRFAENPPTPYAAVERQYAGRFDAYAQALGVERGSILIADAGATLFASKLTVYDIAGLTEPAVLRTLRMGTPVWHYRHPKFYDWVFEEIRPTFVVTHAFWTNVTALEQDPRFARDYVAIDSFADRYVKAAFGRDLHSGEFVRRDALRTPGGLEAMRKSYAFPPFTEPLPFRLADRFEAFRRGPPEVEELRRRAELAASTAKPNPNRAAALYRRLLTSRPDDLGAREALAVVLDRAGRSGEAHDEWLSALVEADRRPDPALAERARARLGDPTLPVPRENDEPGSIAYARRLLAAGRLLDARRVTDRVLAQNPKNADAYFLAGVGSAAEKRPVDAVAAYAKCVELDPRNADCLNNLGFTLAFLGRFSDAVAPLELAIRCRPDWPLPKANLAWVKSEAGKND
ncbi:MAG TPA: tetratricopeptide repeat protein, partial [Polyangiaceae bacterium]